MSIKFSISSMLQLTACIAVLFASYGSLTTLYGFLPGFERLIFTLCLTGAIFPSLVISLFGLPIRSWFCWQSIFIGTITSSWIGFFLVHRFCQSHSGDGVWPNLAGVLLLPFAVISSLIIACFTAPLTTSIQRFRLLGLGKNAPKSDRVNFQRVL